VQSSSLGEKVGVGGKPWFIKKRVGNGAKTGFSFFAGRGGGLRWRTLA
jgi:hypothetical protein